MFKGLIDEAKLELLPARRRDQVLGALRELDLIQAQNPLASHFPHLKQVIFYRFGTPVKVFLGGNQSGKTTAGLANDLIQALDRDMLPEHLRPYKQFEPPFLCRIMAPSMPVLETVLYTKLLEMLPQAAIAGGSWGAGYDRQTRVLHFNNGSKFFFNTYEQETSKLGGASLDRVHYDEEPPLEHRVEGRIRVMARRGDEVFTMTPTEGLTWAYDQLWKEVETNQVAESVYISKEIGVVTVDMDDNPALADEAKDLALQGLSKEQRQARKEGRFVALHGRIYEEFRRERHLIPEMDPGDLPEHKNVVVGIDPGIRNQAAVVWLYLSEGEEMVVFDEGYYEGYTAGRVAQEIHRRNAYWRITPIYYVIDPAARNKEHITGRSVQMEYADHGIVAIAGQNSVPAGINRVKERLEREKLHIADNCSNLLDELEKYRWRSPPRSGEDGKVAPVKKDDHLLDALRYAVMSRPYLPTLDDEAHESELARAMREDQERGDSKRGEYASIGGRL